MISFKGRLRCRSIEREGGRKSKKWQEDGGGARREREEEGGGRRKKVKNRGTELVFHGILRPVLRRPR